MTPGCKDLSREESKHDVPLALIDSSRSVVFESRPDVADQEMMIILLDLSREANLLGCRTQKDRLMSFRMSMTKRG